jgi:hypothetical protein
MCFLNFHNWNKELVVEHDVVHMYTLESREGIKRERRDERE